jgi:PilZ domain
MPELLRSIVNRLREHVGNRRAAPRYSTHLEVALILSVSLGETGSKAQSENSPLRLAGYTRDISETGLALIMPAVHIGGQYLTSPHRTLEITLRLPSGPIQLQATPARYSPLDEDAKDTGYIIGVQITQMSERDKARYKAYLKKLTIE